MYRAISGYRTERSPISHPGEVVSFDYDRNVLTQAVGVRQDTRSILAAQSDKLRHLNVPFFQLITKKFNWRPITPDFKD
jgi:hypothetical protein